MWFARTGIAALAAVLAMSPINSHAASRIKDLTSIEGVRQNQLIAYGLVVGPNGAIIEREIDFALNRLPNLRLALRNADFTTAKRIASAINDYIGQPTAEPLDPSTVQLMIPKQFAGKVVALLTEIEQLQIEPDLPAKIVIDERSGIIVMGRDVRVSTVAVAQGNLTVSISETPQVSQPAPFSRGQTIVVPRTKVGVTEDGKKLALVQEGVSLQQLVDGLNALGIGPRDMIAILQAIKAAGAIQADIEVM